MQKMVEGELFASKTFPNTDSGHLYLKCFPYCVGNHCNVAVFFIGG